MIDTNVLVSALIFPGGAPERVYRLAIEGQIAMVTSRPLLAELGRILEAKFGWEFEGVEQVVAQLVRVGLIVEPTETVADVPRDPADNRVLEAAAAGAADIMVSGDHHLLDLRSWRGIDVLPPAAFLQQWQSVSLGGNPPR